MGYGKIRSGTKNRNFMTIQEQVNFGDSIFKRIAMAVDACQFELAYAIIRTENPPNEWVEEFQSLLDEGKTYKTMKIELIEAVATRLFPYWNVSSISDPVININRDKFSVTLRATVDYCFKQEAGMRHLQGISTEVAHSILLLPLATPKALAMAKKQAFKQLGNLFGLSLSRNIEGEEVNFAKAPDNSLVLEAIEEINKCKTLEELTKVHNLCAKEVQNDTKFTDALLQQKKIINLIDKKHE